MENKKRSYFKLGARASVFSDNANGMKVTKQVPGSTFKPESKLTREALANGHIVSISEAEFNGMMDKLSPGMKAAAYKEQGLKEAPSKDEGGSEGGDEGGSEGGDEGDDEVRADLMKRLSKIQMTKSKRKEVEALSTEELKAFVEQEVK